MICRQCKRLSYIIIKTYESTIFQNSWVLFMGEKIKAFYSSHWRSRRLYFCIGCQFITGPNRSHWDYQPCTTLSKHFWISSQPSMQLWGLWVRIPNKTHIRAWQEVTSSHRSCYKASTNPNVQPSLTLCKYTEQISSPCYEQKLCLSAADLQWGRLLVGLSAWNPTPHLRSLHLLPLDLVEPKLICRKDTNTFNQNLPLKKL